MLYKEVLLTTMKSWRTLYQQLVRVDNNGGKPRITDICPQTFLLLQKLLKQYSTNACGINVSSTISRETLKLAPTYSKSSKNAFLVSIRNL